MSSTSRLFLHKRHLRYLWFHYGIFWSGAIVVGFTAILYASLINIGFGIFKYLVSYGMWLPLIITPGVGALATWLTRRYFKGAEGSGIPQVVASLESPSLHLGNHLLTLRIIVGKIALSFLAIIGGFTIGREGPTVQVGAAIMFNLRRFYPHSNIVLERQLTLAGASAGLSAAFNTPLAGIMFAIEELLHNFSRKSASAVIVAIILAGAIALAVEGDYTYFGSISVQSFHLLMLPAIVLCALLTGLAGGIFTWLTLNSNRWLPQWIKHQRKVHPVWFAAGCGLALAIVGLLSGSTTFGSGYTQADALINMDGNQLPALYPFYKMAAMVLSYLPGIPGGIFAPSLSIGAGFGTLLHDIFAGIPLPILIALAMVGYLSAATQAPITSFVIVMEMVNGHALVIPMMATALLAARVSRLMAPPFYATSAERYLNPPS